MDGLDLQPGETVFGVFCAAGVNFPLLLNRIQSEGKIVGLDGSAGMLAKARQVAAGHGLREGQFEFIRADFSAPSGVEKVVQKVQEYRPRKFLFTLGLTCLQNWDSFFDRVFQSAPLGSVFSIVDVYSRELTPGARLINWIGRADCTRLVWRALPSRTMDYQQVEYRLYRLLDVAVILSWGGRTG